MKQMVGACGGSMAVCQMPECHQFTGRGGRGGGSRVGRKRDSQDGRGGRNREKIYNIAQCFAIEEAQRGGSQQKWGRNRD